MKKTKNNRGKKTKKQSSKSVAKKAKKKSAKKKNTSKKTTQKINKKTKKKQHKKSSKRAPKKKEISLNEQNRTTDSYKYMSGQIPILITIEKSREEFVPLYKLEVSAISKTTELVLEKVRQELIRRVNLGIADISDIKKTNIVEDKFEEMIEILIQKYFPDSNSETTKFLTAYLKIKSIGLGAIDLIIDDENLEEIVINQASEPIWVYHKRHGWLKTNVFLKDEDQVRHFASIIGRRVGRQINVLTPLLDAHMKGGDRVNATLSPVSTAGNTITIRKFSKDPWTITKFLKTGTISADAAAMVWSAIQYELSTIIAGGTASGKTSALNVFSSFFPPNQRIISIEDTREITLPKFLHWVPLNTVLPNQEDKGEISMGDLLVNSLRMRPDRIIVGEVRRKKETETLFEAIHTGHSVYATFHANNAREVIDRLTNPPLNVPKIMLSAISLIIVQFRNRRSGKRRTFQIAEITPKGDENILMQYDAKKDVLVSAKTDPIATFLNSSEESSFFQTIKLFTGMEDSEIKKDHKEKVKILKYLVENEIEAVDDVGRVIAEYYTNKENLMTYVNSNRKLEE